MIQSVLGQDSRTKCLPRGNPNPLGRYRQSRWCCNSESILKRSTSTGKRCHVLLLCQEGMQYSTKTSGETNTEGSVWTRTRRLQSVEKCTLTQPRRTSPHGKSLIKLKWIQMALRHIDSHHGTKHAAWKLETAEKIDQGRLAVPKELVKGQSGSKTSLQKGRYSPVPSMGSRHVSQILFRVLLLHLDANSSLQENCTRRHTTPQRGSGRDLGRYLDPVPRSQVRVVERDSCSEGVTESK